MVELNLAESSRRRKLKKKSILSNETRGLHIVSWDISAINRILKCGHACQIVSLLNSCDAGVLQNKMSGWEEREVASRGRNGWRFRHHVLEAQLRGLIGDVCVRTVGGWERCQGNPLAVTEVSKLNQHS